MNISIEEFKKVEVRIGKILTCEKVEGADRLLKLEVDFGKEVSKRQILSGIAPWYTSEELIGKKLPFVVNLEPRIIRGLESQGMLFAVGSDKPVLLVPSEDVAEGSLAV
jgi:methionine--tRNA ligase beta chain